MSDCRGASEFEMIDDGIDGIDMPKVDPTKLKRIGKIMGELFADKEHRELVAEEVRAEGGL